MSVFRSRGRAEHFRQMGVTVGWWRPEWGSSGVEASGEPAASNDGEAARRDATSRGGGHGARGRGGYAVRSRGAEGRAHNNNDDEWSTGARHTDSGPTRTFDRPRGGGGGRGRGRDGASFAPPLTSSTPMPTQNPDDGWGNAPADTWTTAPPDQPAVQEQRKPASRGGASRGHGRGGSATAPPPTAEADDDWGASTATNIAARTDQPQPAIRGGRPRPPRGAAAWDTSSTRAPEPTQRLANDEPAQSIAARGGDRGRGRGRGRGASGMAAATTRSEELRQPLAEEGDEWSTNAPPPARHVGARGGRGRGRGGSDFPASRAPAAERTDWGTTTSEPWSTAGGFTTDKTEPAAADGGRGRGRGRDSNDLRSSRRVEGFQPSPPPVEEEEDEWSGCVSGRTAKPAGGHQAVSSVPDRSEPGARGGRGRGRGGSASAAAPEPNWWGPGGAEADATTENTGQVARGGARGRGSGQWASGPSAAATTTARTAGFQTTVPRPPQEEEEDEWAGPPVGQQSVPATHERAERGARAEPTRRGAPAAARQPTESYQKEPFGAPQKKDEGAPVFTGGGRGRGRGSSYGERSERGPTAVAQERPSSGFGGGSRQFAATPAVDPAGSDDDCPVADKAIEGSDPATRGAYRGRDGGSGGGELVRQFSNDGFPSLSADAGTRGGYRGRGGGGRGRGAASDSRQR
ncbi:hypothetical protein AAVH_03336 [Aphelenchoides avenae]|nr:hypothetical protein AAVH_03336 [Aphelenchus avenae]